MYGIFRRARMMAFSREAAEYDPYMPGKEGDGDKLSYSQILGRRISKATKYLGDSPKVATTVAGSCGIGVVGV